MTSCERVLLICLLLLSLFATTFVMIIFWTPDRKNSDDIIGRNYLDNEVKEENSIQNNTDNDENMSWGIQVNPTRSQVNETIDDHEYNLVNQTSWTDYSDNWPGDILVKRGPNSNQLIFTDEYRNAMASKGLHPLNIEHRYLHERYLTMNKYCNAPLTKTNDLYDVMGSYYRARVSDSAKLLQCALLKVASSTWMRVLRQLERLKEEKYPYPTLWYKLSLKYDINKPELTAMRYQTYTKFLIVRHPFSRLFSGYRDKFVVVSEYGDNFADQIVRVNYLSNMTNGLINQMRQELKRGGSKLTSGLSNDVIKQLRRLDARRSNFKITFLEFLNFIISPKHPNGFKGKDDHFRAANLVCNPCAVRYDIIAKYETLQNDSDLILEYLRIHHDHKVSFSISKSASSDSCNDAYKDIPLTVRRSLYEIYKDDFLVFGYEYREEGDNLC